MIIKRKSNIFQLLIKIPKLKRRMNINMNLNKLEFDNCKSGSAKDINL